MKSIIFLLLLYLSFSSTLFISPLSSFSCRFGVCKISNIYQIHNSFHIFDPIYDHKSDETFLIPLGIGYMTPVVWMDGQTFKSGRFNYTSYREQLVDIRKKYVEQRLLIPIFVHYSIGSLHHVLNTKASTIQVIDQPSVLLVPIWNNIMRAFYAAASIIFSTRIFNVSNPKIFFIHSKHFLQGASVVLQNSLNASLPFKEFFKAMTNFSIDAMFDNRDPKFFKNLVLGSSPLLKIAELKTESFIDQEKYVQRNVAFRMARDLIFNHFVGNLVGAYRSRQELGKKPIVTIVKRINTRNIINLSELVGFLKKLPITLRICRFERLSLRQQILLAYQSDIFIAVHGAAMIHLAWMHSNTTIIELFPAGFRKNIYKNLVRVFRSISLAGHRTTNTPINLYLSWQEQYNDREEILFDLDWTNVTSKEAYRKRDLLVHPKSLIELVKFGLNFNKGETGKFLLYAPWEQLNNQILGLFSACAVSNILNRTLVLPRVGYRVKNNATSNGLKRFYTADFFWKPFDYYFDSCLFNENLVCGSTIREENFRQILDTIAFNSEKPFNESVSSLVKSIHSHPFYKSSNVFSNQTTSYYKDILLFPSQIPHIIDPLNIKLSARDINSEYKKYDKDPFLLLGNMFYFYDFEKNSTYPQLNYTDFLESNVYSGIRSCLKPRPEIEKLADILLKTSERFSKNYLAVHVRRGDYAEKCVNDLRLLKEKFPKIYDTECQQFWDSCWQSSDVISKQIKKALAQYPQFTPTYLYFSTNQGKLNDIVGKIKEEFFIVTLKDLTKHLLDRCSCDHAFKLHTNSLLRTIIFSDKIQIPIMDHSTEELIQLVDPNIWTLVEQHICSYADIFIGNRFSSFSRTIVDNRGGYHCKLNDKACRVSFFF